MRRGRWNGVKITRAFVIAASRCAVPAPPVLTVGLMARRKHAHTSAVELPGEAAHDRHWAGEVRSSIRCSAALWGLLLLVDWCSGSLTPWRGALWLALAALLFWVLYPSRVSAGRGWLASRGLLRQRRVRTDLLVSVRWIGGVGQRLVLRDALGGRVEISPRVLAANPELWHRLAEDTDGLTARGPGAHGSPACPEDILHRLSERIDRETARAVFQVSGLERSEAPADAGLGPGPDADSGNRL